MERIQVEIVDRHQEANKAWLILIYILLPIVITFLVVFLSFFLLPNNDFANSPLIPNIGIITFFGSIVLIFLRKKIFNRRTRKPLLIGIGIIILLLVSWYFLPIISQQIKQTTAEHLSESEINFIASIYAKYPEAPTLAEFEQESKINEHADSICKPNCGNQFLSHHAQLHQDGSIIECYCSDSNSSEVNLRWYEIDSRTGEILKAYPI